LFCKSASERSVVQRADSRLRKKGGMSEAKKERKVTGPTIERKKSEPKKKTNCINIRKVNRKQTRGTWGKSNRRKKGGGT